ncbi:MAG TPA: iron-containing redox enzyme family protein [Nocardioidaceae bacterium]|nr:iron-containing redox enzyme family protein [Nocardioidaceae bacterium]
MKLPEARGPLSAQVIELLEAEPGGGRSAPHPDAGADALADEDFHLALWMLYELHYRGFEDVPDHEWDPALVALRVELEGRFEAELRVGTADFVRDALGSSDDLVEQIRAVIDAVEGPSLARYLQREATRAEVLDFLMQRSLYHLKESDPHAFVVPRIDGRAKVALAELQYDEYGGGRPDRLHSQLYADALEACGFDHRYGAYVDQVPGHTLAVNNVMSLFGLNRRLRGAALGHLAAFESTSSVPCRRIAGGVERVGLPDVVAAYFHEHVEADSVHEQVALRDICGGLVADNPALRDDVLFGVAACLYLDVLAARALLGTWERDRLRDDVDEQVA